MIIFFIMVSFSKVSFLYLKSFNGVHGSKLYHVFKTSKYFLKKYSVGIFSIEIEKMYSLIILYFKFNLINIAVPNTRDYIN